MSLGITIAVIPPSPLIRVLIRSICVIALTWLSHSTQAAELNFPAIEFTSQEKAYIDQAGTIRMCVDPDWVPFEHVNEESAWFATNPSINAVCCGHTIRLVQCGDGLCAAWKGDGRFITIVGAETLETLSDVIAVIEETDQPSG